MPCDRNSILLEIYKTHSNHSQNLMTVNNTSNSLYMAFHAFWIPFVYQKSTWFLFIGIMICCLWFITIKYMRVLNSAKIKILHEIEQELSVDFYNKEWVYMSKDNKIFGYEISMNKITRWIPIGFIAIYLYLIIVNFVDWFGCVVQPCKFQKIFLFL